MDGLIFEPASTTRNGISANPMGALCYNSRSRIAVRRDRHCIDTFAKAIIQKFSIGCRGVFHEVSIGACCGDARNGTCICIRYYADE